MGQTADGKLVVGDVVPAPADYDPKCDFIAHGTDIEGKKYELPISSDSLSNATAHAHSITLAHAPGWMLQA